MLLNPTKPNLKNSSEADIQTISTYKRVYALIYACMNKRTH